MTKTTTSHETMKFQELHSNGGTRHVQVTSDGAYHQFLLHNGMSASDSLRRSAQEVRERIGKLTRQAAILDAAASHYEIAEASPSMTAAQR